MDRSILLPTVLWSVAAVLVLVGLTLSKQL